MVRDIHRENPPPELAVLEHLPHPVVVLDLEGSDRFVYRWLNNAAAKQFGVRLDDIWGKTPAEAFPGRAGDRLMARQLAAAADGRPRSYEYPLSVPLGEVWIATHLAPVRDADGQVTRLIASMQDITQQRRAEAEHADTKAGLRSLESEVEQYIAIAAHDLRSPMNQVSQIAGLLRDGFVDYGDGKLELIDMLEETGTKALSLISDVLAYARATGTEPRIERVSLAGLSEDLFAVLDPRGYHRLSADAAMIEVDDIALQIVLRNLIDNAIKHAGAPTASVHVGFLGRSAGGLEFSVTDRGQGFANPATAFLDTGKFRYDSGFGLLGVRRMIEARDGAIWAERSPSGSGVSIRFRLPGKMARAPAELPGVLAS